MERWYINHGLNSEKDMLKINNLNINNGILQGDSLSPLFCITLITLDIEFKNIDYGFKTNILY